MTQTARIWLIALGASLAAAGCNDQLPSIDWQRMLDQPRGKAYKSSSYFADGKLMQAPPEGTRPVTHESGPQSLTEGMDGAAFTTSIPLQVDRNLLQRGRNRFEIFCATCHGITGTGETLVASNMDLRKPPSLVVDPVRSLAVGRVFQVISQGYGLMPSYVHELPIADRWAVVAYLRALQRSHATALASLPEPWHQQALEALP